MFVSVQTRKVLMSTVPFNVHAQGGMAAAGMKQEVKSRRRKAERQTQ